MNFAVDLGLGSQSRATFNPSSALFGNGEQGYWLDSSDFSTMFQDAAGTTPVTDVGQSVRLMLDKSGRGNNFTQGGATNAPTLQQDASGRYYLLFDGSDDWMQSASTINPGAIDKAQVFVGVRKLIDSGAAALLEASAIIDTNNGSFLLTAPATASANYGFGLRGTTTTTRVATSFASPTTNVLSCQYDIAQSARETEVTPAINGSIPTMSGSGAASAGSGNFQSYTHYIGRRGGTALPFNGRVYQIVMRYGPNLTAAQIAQAEAFVNSKTGAY